MAQTDKSTLSAAEQWQELICRLPEVYSANVIFSQDGEPSEIHILASEEKSCKSIVRDVQSAINANFATSVDYHIISVAQIRDDNVPQPAKNSRFRFVGSDIRSADGRLDVSVTLSLRGNTYTGSSSGSTSLYSRRVCLVEATLAAVASYSSELAFDFAGLQTTQIGSSDAVLIKINCPQSNQVLLGSALLSQDMDSSVINGTLSAINRRVSLLP
ncbi:MAG: hypothetical protein VB112_03515 [Oscillospiraceae bacterium]|nr:hypothetical protein [Oscillospiraceae bacterium]